MTSETTATAPALHTPDLEPVPMRGCLVCEAAAMNREAARRLGRAVSVRSANETIRQHPHHRTTDTKGAAE